MIDFGWLLTGFQSSSREFLIWPKIEICPQILIDFIFDRHHKNVCRIWQVITFMLSVVHPASYYWLCPWMSHSCHVYSWSWYYTRQGMHSNLYLPKCPPSHPPPQPTPMIEVCLCLLYNMYNMCRDSLRLRVGGLDVFWKYTRNSSIILLV